MKTIRLLCVGLVVLLVCACAPQRPQVAVRSTLGLAWRGAPGTTAVKLEIGFSSPTGMAWTGAEPTIIFSKPVRQGEGPTAAIPPLEIEPAVPGRWEWVGSKALHFVHAAPLPSATQFKVRVPAGIMAADGTTLAEGVSWSFDTPRPAVNAAFHGPANPNDPSLDVPMELAPSTNTPAANLPTDPIRLVFNQRIDIAALSSSLKVSALGKGTAATPVAFALTGVPDEPAQVMVHLEKAPSDATLRIETGALKSAEGALRGEPTTVLGRTRGPLKVLGLRCRPPEPTPPNSPEWVTVGKDTKCASDTAIELHLSNAVTTEAVEASLKVTPTPLSYISGGSWAEDGSYVVDLNPAYGAQQLSFALQNTLLDDRGGKLSAPFKARVKLVSPPEPPPEPYVTLGLVGTYGRLDPKASLPVRAEGVTNLSVYAVPLSVKDLLARRGKELTPEPPAASLVQSLPDPKPKVAQTYSIPLAKLFDKPLVYGTFAFVARYRVPGKKEDVVRVEVVTLTDLTVYTRTSHGRARIWVLTSAGTPVPDAKVTVHTDAGSSTPVSTNTDGRADIAIPLNGKKPLLVVTKGDDSIRHDMAADGGRDHGATVKVFTERGVYRPGDTVHIKGIARAIDDDGRLVVPSGPIKGTLRDMDGGKPTLNFEAKLNEFGTFTLDYLIAQDAKLGWMAVDAELVGESLSRRNWTRFAVAEYHPLEFELDASMPGGERTLGDEVPCVAAAKYLHGSPLAGASVTATWRIGGGSFSPRSQRADNERYEFGSSTPTPSWSATDTGRLDKSGNATFKQVVKLPALPGPATVVCTVQVRDYDGRELEASSNETLHPGDFYIGIWAPTRVVTGAAFAPEMVAVTPSESLVESSVELQASVVSPGESTPLGKCIVRTGTSPKACSFTAPPRTSPTSSESRQIILSAKATDSKGRTITTTRTVWLELPPVASPPEPPPQPAPPRAPELEIVAAHGWTIGDHVKVSVSSPWKVPARAMLSIERETVVEERFFTLDPSGTTLDVVVTEAMAPSVSVRVVAVQGAASRETHFYTDVDPKPLGLKVVVTPSASNTQPGASLDLDVAVTDYNGQPVKAELTLWAVDEGSLRVTDYQLPRPEFMVDALGSHAVVDFDSHEYPLSIVTYWGRHRSKPPSVRMGATSVGTPSVPRSDFRQTVFYAPSLVTDAAGKVRHRITLPDQLTTYRVMAVAVTTKDRFGSGEAPITTQKPLMVRPSLPAAIRAGDELTIGATVIATEALSKPVTVEISSDGLSLVGDRTHKITVTKETPQNVLFRATAPRAGDFSITVKASSDGVASDVVLLKGKVVAPTFVEEVSLQGESKVPVAEGLGDLSEARPDVGELTVTVSRSRLVGLEHGLKQLLEYPYGCAEQTSSRLLPLVALRDLATELGVDLGADTGTMVSEAVTRLQSYQQSDGGFGLWATSPKSDPWLSAWVVFVLQAAKDHGATMPIGLLDKATSYLEARLTETMTPTTQGATVNASTIRAMAIAVDVLAIRGSDIQAATQWLMERKLTAVEQALLLHALATTGGHDDLRAKLLTPLANGIRLDGPFARAGGGESLDWVPVSSVLSSALTLRALVAHDPKHVLIDPLARGLVADGKGGAWPTTHETAWALLGLDAYRSIRQSDAKAAARIFWGDNLLLEHKFVPGEALQKQLVIPMKDLRSSNLLTFDVDAGGTIYYDARLRFARTALPTKPVDQGIEVTRTLTVQGTARPDGVIVEGDLVRVDVQLITPSKRSAVAVEIPTPGGLYVPDQDRLSKGVPRPFVRREVRDDRVVYFADELSAGIHRISFFVRARHAGAYMMPSAKAYEMYAPDVAGWTAVERVVIKREDE